MDRKEFLKKSILSSAAATVIPTGLKSLHHKSKESTYDTLIDQVGFNHLPNKENKTMNTVLHKANTRGHADHGWLESYHSFSFANYRNPERMNFGVLRVLNDDVVAGGKGFNTHPHDNMEIISIPLSGDLEHKDSMGTVSVIKQGDVQVMSAGTGIYHSEYNKNQSDMVKFLQIWLFPNQRNVNPRYDQISIQDLRKPNEFYQILSPSKDDQGVWIHQNAWFHMANFTSGHCTEYELKDPNNGVYAFVLDGQIKIEQQELSTRDGFGVWNTKSIQVESNSDSQILLMEVPMQI